MIFFLIVTLLLFLTGEFFLYLFSDILYIKSVLLGYFTSLFNIVTGFVSLRWAFKRKENYFYITLYGGMALRLVVFIVALFLIHNYTQLPLLGFMASFIVFYVLMQYFEIKLINQELKGNQK